MTVLTVDFNLKHGFLERVLRIKTNNFIVVFLIFIQLCDSRKIHYLTSEFHVKLHLNPDIYFRVQFNEECTSPVL